MENTHKNLIGKTCFYRSLYSANEKTGVIASIERRVNLNKETSTRAVMTNGDSESLSALWFPLSLEQDL